MSDSLSEYLRAKEPGKVELAGLWQEESTPTSNGDTPTSREVTPTSKVPNGVIAFSPMQKYRLTEMGKDFTRRRGERGGVIR